MLSLLIFTVTAVLLFALPYVIAYKNALGYIHRPTSFELIDSTEIPSHIGNLLQPWIDQLITHDFSVVSFHKLYADRTEEETFFGVALQHSSLKTHVGLMARQKPMLLNSVICNFSSYWQETNLNTTNTSNLFAYSENSLERTQYIDRGSVDELWSSHQNFLSSICATENLQELTVADWISKLEQGSRKLLELRVNKGENYWVNQQEMTCRQHPWLVLKMMVRIIRYQKAKNQHLPKNTNNADDVIDKTQIELEVRNYFDRPQKKAMSRTWRVGILISSFVLFCVVYAHQFSLIKLVTFVTVLMLHEAGHVLAMRAFGYRDTTMLFIPWLGALATGKKENSSLSEKVWISLAGPLPGIVLGVFLSIVFPSSNVFVRDLSIMLISLNLFNLLPIYPLDGGHVMNSLVFSRNPYLTVIFQSIGVFLLGLIGLMQPLTLVFAILIAWSITLNFRLAKIKANLRKEFKDSSRGDRESLVRDIFTSLASKQYRHLPVSFKILVVDELLNNEEQNKSKISTRILLSFFYVFSLAGGFIGGLYVLIPRDVWVAVSTAISDSRNYMQKTSKDNIEKANQNIASNPQNVSAYLQRARGYYGLQQYAIALNDVNKAIKLDTNNAEAYSLRGTIRQKMGDTAGARSDLQQSTTLLWTQQIKKSRERIQQQPNDISAYLESAGAKRMLGDKQGSIDDYNTALKIKTNSVEILIDRASIGLELNEYQSALLDANYALELEPKNSEVYQLRADLHDRIGDQTSAANDRKKAELFD
jgi:Zn-dependent protease/tetratricopeptide (TPR) repeat protein